MAPDAGPRDGIALGRNSVSVPGALLALLGASAIGVIAWTGGGFRDTLDGFLSVAGLVGPVFVVALLHLAGVIGRRLAGGFILGSGGLLLSLFLSSVARTALQGSLDGYDWRVPGAAVVMVVAGFVVAALGRREGTV